MQTIYILAANAAWSGARAARGRREDSLGGPGSSHAVGLERAAEFATLVLGFLQRRAVLRVL
jgi:hypothetical protein